MKKLRLTFYGDDFTGSTDALEQLSIAGIRTMLFIEPPTPAQLKRFPDLQAIGVAGMTRSMVPREMAMELRPALKKLKALGAPHVHYKVCSTFDSSPEIGSIGCVLDVVAEIFHAPFIPLLVAAPALGRYTIFGTHFARFGIGSEGEIHRLDRHPSISKHPVTPMTEADLRLHLAKQTQKKVALFDLLKIALPENESCTELAKILAAKSDVVLFDALSEADLKRVGGLIDSYAKTKQPLFSVGSSGIERALTAHWNQKPCAQKIAAPAKQILIGSGSCSPVTSGQIAYALKKGFAEITLDVMALADVKKSEIEIQRATVAAVKILRVGKNLIVHTTRDGSDQCIAAKLKSNTANIFGTALGKVLRGALAQVNIPRLCIAGGDTSGFVARALGVETLEMIAPLTPGAPLCRTHAPDSPADKMEIIFKGGQVGAENYFETILKPVAGKPSHTEAQRTQRK